MSPRSTPIADPCHLPAVTRRDSTTELREVTRYDRGELRPAQRTDEGFLLVEMFVAKPGVLNYRQADGSVVREFIPPEELHHEDSLATLGRKSLTLEHPEEDVDPRNVGELGVGDVDGEVEVVKVGGYVKVRGAIRRQDAIDDVEAGRRVGVSPGYKCQIDPTPGVHPEYGAYDQIQRRRRYNHVALTEAARGGVDIRLRADSAVQVPAPEQHLAHESAAQGGTHNRRDGGVMNPKERLVAAYVQQGVKRADAEKMVEHLSDADAKALVERFDAADRADAGDLAAVKKERDDFKKKADELQAKVDMFEAAEAKKKDEEKEEETVAGMEADEKKKDSLLAWHSERTELLALATKHRLDSASVDKLPNAGIREAIVRKVNPKTPADASPEYIRAAYDILAATRQDAADPYAAFSTPTTPASKVDEGRDDGADDVDPTIANFQQAHARRFDNAAAK